MEWISYYINRQRLSRSLCGSIEIDTIEMLRELMIQNCYVICYEAYTCECIYYNNLCVCGYFVRT